LYHTGQNYAILNDKANYLKGMNFLMKITTIRHGETDWNVAGKIQGSVDTELNQNGITQAERLAKRLADVPCDIIFSSDLKRAKKTAEIINSQHGVHIITSDSLRESDFGEFEGQSLSDDEVYAAFAEYMDRHVHVYFDKVQAYLSEILRSGHENIFIVGHFGTVRAVACYLLKVPPEKRGRFVIDNTAIHMFEKKADDSFEMTLENDTAHLE
jgi:broad specificity phosphatase PhoE